MAGKTKDMSQIKQLLLLHQQGKGKKAIARILGMSKNTVKSYLCKLDGILSDKKQGITIKDLISLENPVLEAKFHSGNPAYKKEERYEQLQEQMPQLLEELDKKGITRHLLWQEYRERCPQGYSYAQFCFHLQQQKIASKPSMVLNHKPGDKLFIDFAGKQLYYTDKVTGELIPCEVFIACLPYSDYSFVMAVPSQTIPDFLYALGQCLSSLGGVPAALVPDNLKSAITKSNRYELEISKALADFASHYGTAVIPARARKPKDKALVENQVKMIYSRVYARLRDKQFFSLAALNKAIAEMAQAHNQTRMQQKPYCREERFLSHEKKHLRPLPEQDFELKYYKRLKVAKNNHIYLSDDKHYYSVPYKFIGKKVKVVYTRKMVYIFFNREQIAVHIRNYMQGRYSTEKKHLCSHHQHYLDRNPDYYLALGRKQSPTLHRLMEALFNQPGKHPEQLYKSCDGLLHLGRKSDKDAFEEACRTALDNGFYSYGFVKRFLGNNMSRAKQKDQQPAPLPAHNNIRGKAYYKQITINFNPTNKNKSE